MCSLRTGFKESVTTYQQLRVITFVDSEKKDCVMLKKTHINPFFREKQMGGLYFTSNFYLT